MLLAQKIAEFVLNAKYDILPQQVKEKAIVLLIALAVSWRAQWN